jgi:predicted lipoprotein with Yx(FWY)xxD motif
MGALCISILRRVPHAKSSFAKEKKEKAAQMPADVKVNNMVLTDSKGMTLYTFDKDATPGKSACNGPCATNWPPLTATKAKAMGDWTVVTRDDGTKQWAYKGKPLYRFAKDTKSGDMTGDGFNNGVWHTAKQ